MQHVSGKVKAYGKLTKGRLPGEWKLKAFEGYAFACDGIHRSYAEVHLKVACSFPKQYIDRYSSMTGELYYHGGHGGRLCMYVRSIDFLTV